MNIEVLRGPDAERLLDDPSFIDAWRRLCAACPWATAFQGPGFVLTWYRTYRPRFAPLLVLSRATAGGDLDGLLTLAEPVAAGRVVVAGAWQAEYHAWVCAPHLAATFPPAALSAIRPHLPSSGLRFRYLPPGAPVEWAARRSDGARRCLVAAHRRPLMRLGDGSAVARSLAKSGNKSRLRRMKKIGPLEFRRVTDPADLDRLLDDLIAIYDTRQLAVNGSAPFRNDPLKRAFHVAMAATPGLLHTTVLTVGPHLVAAHLGLPTRRELQLGLIAHNPFFAAHSPGKFQLLFLGQLLIEEGFEQIDLTPGGDSYKERFANAWDEVHTLVAFPSHAATLRGRAPTVAAGAARAALRRTGISPARATAMKDRVTHPSAAIRAVGSTARRTAAWAASARELRVYTREVLLPEHDVPAFTTVRRDHLADLLAYTPDGRDADARRFVSEALDRLEAGHHVFTRVEQGRLVSRAWLADRPDPELRARLLPRYDPPPNAALAFDVDTSPGAPALAADILGALVRGAAEVPGTEHVVIAVAAADRAAISAVERAGFAHRASLRSTTRLGRTRRARTTPATRDVRTTWSNAGHEAAGPRVP